MAEAIGQDCELIEFGSGSGLKTRLLLEQLRAAAGLSARRHLGRAARAVRRATWPSASPRFEIIPVHADFTGAVLAPGDRRPARHAASSISRARRSATSARGGRAACSARSPGWSATGGGLLIGFDLDKDESIVWPAYNDRRGVSAAFNLNLLARINRELDADFDLDAFSPPGRLRRASRNASRCISSASETRSSGSPGRAFAFDAGETIHTEDSYKYSLEHFARLTSRAGFTLDRAVDRPDAVFLRFSI